MREAQHTEPAWGDRSDFAIEGGGDVSTEQLFARQVGPGRFELCCIPFFLYDTALGDVVETDDDYLVRRVVEPSGRSVFRVWFGSTSSPPRRGGPGARRSRCAAGVVVGDLLAVDARDGQHAQRIADHLQDAAHEGRLVFETGLAVT